MGIKVALTALQVLFGCHGSSYYSEAGITTFVHLPGNDRLALKTLNRSEENAVMQRQQNKKSRNTLTFMKLI